MAGVCGRAFCSVAQAANPGQKALEEALEIGRAKIEAGDIAGAIADYDYALASSKAPAVLFYARGDARLSGGDIAGADADYKRAIQLTGEWVPPFVGRASALIMQGKLRAAQAQLRSALALEPRNLDARYLLGIIANKEERFRDAIELLEGVAKDAAEDTPPDVWLMLARSQVMQSDETAAQIAFARYQKAEPQLNIEAIEVRAFIRYATGDYESCLLDVALLEKSGRSMMLLRDSIQFARREFKTLVDSYENVISKGERDPGFLIQAHILQLAAAGKAGPAKPVVLPEAKLFADSYWEPLYTYLMAEPEARKMGAAYLAPTVIGSGKLSADDAAWFHVFAGLALENDRLFDEARAQYDLGWKQGGKPGGSAWIARQLRQGLR